MHYEWSFERLARYAGRPPLASERLSRLPDGRLLYRLKHRWRDGTTHIIYEPLELMERLAALVPPPRFNLTRYSGVLAPASAFRPLIVPQEEGPLPAPHVGCQGNITAADSVTNDAEDRRGRKPRNYPWAQLMERVLDQSTNCMSRRSGDFTGPHHAPLSSLIRTGDRMCRAPYRMGR